MPKSHPHCCGRRGGGLGGYADSGPGSGYVEFIELQGYTSGYTEYEVSVGSTKQSSTIKQGEDIILIANRGQDIGDFSSGGDGYREGFAEGLKKSWRHYLVDCTVHIRN